MLNLIHQQNLSMSRFFLVKVAELSAAFTHATMGSLSPFLSKWMRVRLKCRLPENSSKERKQILWVLLLKNKPRSWFFLVKVAENLLLSRMLLWGSLSSLFRRGIRVRVGWWLSFICILQVRFFYKNPLKKIFFKLFIVSI